MAALGSEREAVCAICGTYVNDDGECACTFVALTDGGCWCSREGCTENYLVPCSCPCHGDVDAWELAA